VGTRQTAHGGRQHATSAARAIAAGSTKLDRGTTSSQALSLLVL
jgi:hypothetical protein